MFSVVHKFKIRSGEFKFGVKVSIAAASSYIKITLFYKKVTLQVHLPTFIGAGKLYFTNLRSV